MPGLIGIIRHTQKDENRNAIKTMLKCLMHEKFYTSGSYIEENIGIYIGWACHEGSFCDCLPIWNEKKDICLFFSGEEYSDGAAIEALKARGHDFHPERAEYLVHMYEEDGMGFLEKLNGSFRGLLIDRREPKAVLFNDRYGLGRLYCHEDDDGFYFSSEAKALLKVFPKLRQLDFSSLGELFSCGCVLENRTLFPGVSLIPGGSSWAFFPHRPVVKESYFNRKRWEDLPRLPDSEYAARLKDTFARIVPRYFRGKDRIGMSLTGGIDTRMIMAWSPAHPFKLPCYTFGGMYRDCADVKIAREVASVCQQHHETIGLNKRFFSEFPALAKKSVVYSDGTMDVSGAVELFVNRMAREIAPVRLTGNYGDQLLRGVIGFKPGMLQGDIFSSDFTPRVQSGIRAYAEMPRNPPVSFFAFKQLPWYHYGRLSVELTQVTMRSPFLDNDLVALAYQAPAEPAGNNAGSLRLIADGDPALSGIATDRGVVLRPVPIANKVRRLCREFMIKAEYAYDYGMPQWLARADRFLAPLHLEKVFLGRHKFYHFRVWYRGELAQYVRDVLLDPRTRARPYLRGRQLEEVVVNHLEGRRNYTQEIHWLLTSELIQRHLIEKM